MKLQTMPLKFRVWDKSVGEMVGVNLSIAALKVCLQTHNYWAYDGEYLSLEFSQDTGLKDKDKESIYIGDIVESHSNCGVVEYKDGCIQVHYPSCEGAITDWFCFDELTDELKVIGNIWQNPKLLEEK